MVIFFELELAGLSAQQLRKLIRAPKLARYKNYLTKMLARKKHKLSEREEHIFADKALTSSSAFTKLFTQEHSAKKYSFKAGKSTKQLTQTMLLDKLRDKKREVRKQATLAMNSGLAEDSQRLTFIYNTLIRDKQINDKYRNFAYPEESRHLANEIERTMVDAMTDTIAKNYSVVHRFYRFKRELLGYRKLYEWDRYAPVGKTIQSIPFSKARQWTLDAFYSFSEEYGSIAEKFFEKNWIDASIRPGKRGGGYCSFVTTDTHPVIFMNYTGNIGDVYTLAHELGHGIHAYLLREQGPHNQDTPLTIAETASVFAELLLFQSLKESIRDREKLIGLYMHKIESSFATSFRQTSMYLFERDVHAHFRKNGPLSTEEFDSYWLKRTQQMYGTSVSLSKEHGKWWSYIPHIMSMPFYVYAYSFGELLTLALFQRYLEMGDAFVPKYLDFLEAGSSKTPKELVRPLGVNLNKKEFWQKGIVLMRELIKDAKRL